MVWVWLAYFVSGARCVCDFFYRNRINEVSVLASQNRELAPKVGQLHSAIKLRRSLKSKFRTATLPNQTGRSRVHNNSQILVFALFFVVSELSPSCVWRMFRRFILAVSFY